MKAILITEENQSQLAGQWFVEDTDYDDRLPIGYYLIANFGADYFETLTASRFDLFFQPTGEKLDNDYFDIERKV